MEQELFIQMSELEDRHWWFSGRRAIISQAIARLPLPKPAKILEIGCGTGGNLAMLSQYGAVEAMECDETARMLAEGRRHAKVSKGRLPDDIPFPHSQFDMVVLLDVLEHLDDEIPCITELSKRLINGGYCIITVPAFPFLWSDHDRTHQHRRRYRLESLETVIKRSGLQVRYITYFNFWLFGALAAFRLFTRLLPERKTGADVNMPNPLINSFLKHIFMSERVFIGKVRLPFGLSLLAVAQKNTESA
jgi:SAM-dependent methyltransferase